MDKMKEETIKIDLNELKKEKERNIKEREWFIDYWVNYIKSHSDEEWSSQQNIVINSQLSNLKSF